MKLLSAHVVAFGMLKDKEYLFKEGLNCFEAPNGRGKTTLLSFVKAVLFGMEGSSAKSRFVERDRYEPSSSEYGGSVTLEHQGTEYRIERFFMKKRETTDEVRVFRNGVLVNADEVGTFFFGVDRASFERTLYMTATDVEVACTDGIRAKIGNYTNSYSASR